jgi:hypothetical protein
VNVCSCANPSCRINGCLLGRQCGPWPTYQPLPAITTAEITWSGPPTIEEIRAVIREEIAAALQERKRSSQKASPKRSVK